MRLEIRGSKPIWGRLSCIQDVKIVKNRFVIQRETLLLARSIYEILELLTVNIKS
jgi:hypothetical protein